jgi:hypothetical protein
LKETNKLRFEHLADAVKLDIKFSGLIQKEVDALTDAELAFDLPTCFEGGVGAQADIDAFIGTGKPCNGKKTYLEAAHPTCPKTKIAMTVYTETDTAKMKDFRTTGRATTKSYEADLQNYLFSKNRPINKDGTTTDKFTNIAWKKTKLVGFALRGKYAVLGYCSLAPTKATTWKCTVGGVTTGDPECKAGASCGATTDGYCENVKIKGCFKDGYNVCFNELQIRAVNQNRLVHKETNLVKLDANAAKKLHAEMNKATYTDFATLKTAMGTDSTWKSCQLLKYTTTDTVAT